MSELKIHRTGPDSVQAEWKGVLLTLQINPFHGLSGSVAKHEDGKVKLLEFHGKHPEKIFPLSFHESELEK